MTSTNPTWSVEVESIFRGVLLSLKTPQIEELFQAMEPINFSSLKEPQTGLIMLTAIDGYAESFHLGEVLVSVAEITCDGYRGHATVMGDDTRRAVLAAAVNAVCQQEQAQRRLTVFHEKLLTMVRAREADQQQEAAITAATRVRFHSMAPEKS